MAKLIDCNIKQLTIMIAFVHIIDVVIFLKDHSRYISALNTFVYVMPNFCIGVGVREVSTLVV